MTIPRTAFYGYCFFEHIHKYSEMGLYIAYISSADDMKKCLDVDVGWKHFSHKYNFQIENRLTQSTGTTLLLVCIGTYTSFESFNKYTC